MNGTASYVRRPLALNKPTNSLKKEALHACRVPARLCESFILIAPSLSQSTACVRKECHNICHTWKDDSGSGVPSHPVNKRGRREHVTPGAAHNHGLGEGEVEQQDAA